MKVIHSYDPKVTWAHEDISKFLGSFQMSDIEIGLGISQRDPNHPDHCYFNVAIWKTATHQDGSQLFKGLAEFTFLVEVANEIPTPKFFFDLILKSSENYAKIFWERTHRTNLRHHKTPVPQYRPLKQSIEQTIGAWKKQQEFGLN